MTETVSRPPSGQQTPIREPAESGPSSGRFEFGLTRTNEPVPAPIESIRTSGMFSTKRAMSGVWVISKRPSVISAMSNEVPPMSVQRTLRRPIRWASAWPPTTPPIGPETSVRAELPAPRSRSSRRARPSRAAQTARRAPWSPRAPPSASRATAPRRRPRSPSSSAAADRGASGTARRRGTPGPRRRGRARLLLARRSPPTRCSCAGLR